MAQLSLQMLQLTQTLPAAKPRLELSQQEPQAEQPAAAAALYLLQQQNPQQDSQADQPAAASPFQPGKDSAMLHSALHSAQPYHQ